MTTLMQSATLLATDVVIPVVVDEDDHDEAGRDAEDGDAQQNLPKHTKLLHFVRQAKIGME